MSKTVKIKQTPTKDEAKETKSPESTAPLGPKDKRRTVRGPDNQVHTMIVTRN